jgi:hypothetical protein
MSDIEGGVDLAGERGEAGEVDLTLGGLGGLRVGQVADPKAKCANETDGVASQRHVDVEPGVGEGGGSASTTTPMSRS